MENSNRGTVQNQSSDFWQAEVSGQVYDTTFAGIAEWVNEGSIRSSDRVRRGNLRWIEAGRVPALLPFFNAKGNGLTLNDVKFKHTEFLNNTRRIDSPDSNNCFVHTEQKAVFQCEICLKNYCEICFSDEQTKDCPMCGANCRSLDLPEQVRQFSDIETEIANQDSNDFDVRPAPVFDPRIGFPSDALKTKTREIGLLYVIFGAILLSGLGSYIWAYEYNPESESVLNSLPEVAALDTKLKTDLEVEKKKSEQNNAQRKRKEELKYVNENQIYAHGAAVRLRKEEIEIDNQTAQNNFPRAENIIRETHSRERAKIIRNYQDSRSKRSFIEIFIASFIFTFSGLLTVRYFTKK